MFTVALFLGLGLNTVLFSHARALEAGSQQDAGISGSTTASSTNTADAEAQESQPGRDDQTDPTVPGEELLRRMDRSTSPSAAELFESAMRLHDAGLTNQARERVDQLRQLDDVPLEIRDEAEIWWASVPPTDQSAQDLFDSAKRLQSAGLTLQARERIDQLREFDDIPLEILDEAEIWWASESSKIQIDAASTNQMQTLPPPVALPAIPKIALKGLVLSTPESGMAVLEVGGIQLTIPLIPRDEQTRVPIPPSQFFAMRAALEQRSQLLSGVLDKPLADSYEMCLRCSFEHDDIIFNLESFSANTLTLIALPHNKRIFVRAGSMP